MSFRAPQHSGCPVRRIAFYHTVPPRPTRRHNAIEQQDCRHSSTRQRPYHTFGRRDDTRYLTTYFSSTLCHYPNPNPKPYAYPTPPPPLPLPYIAPLQHLHLHSRCYHQPSLLRIYLTQTSRPHIFSRPRYPSNIDRSFQPLNYLISNDLTSTIIISDRP